MRSTRARSAALVVVGACLCLPAAASAAGQIPLHSAKSSLSTGPAASGASGARKVVKFRTLDPKAVATAKARAALESSLSLDGFTSPQAAIFNGVNQPGVSAVSHAPPDTTGAIGPSNYFEPSNDNVAVYNRTLGLVASTDLDTFAQHTSTCDPQINWDQTANRWLFAAIDCSDSSANYALLFGWSKTASPTSLTSNWCMFNLNTSASGQNLGFTDYPKLGHNANFGLIGTNDFNASGSFTDARVFMFPKPASGATTCTPPTIFWTNPLTNADTTQTFTPVPAQEVDNPANGYVVAGHFAGSGSASKVMVFHAAGTTSAPTFTSDGDVTVPSYSTPANIPQPGVSTTIDSSDTRVTQAVGRADSAIAGEGIWFQHTVANGSGRSVVRWYEINGPAHTLRQSGTISSATLNMFNGAISPTNAGDSSAVINYSTGSSAQTVKLKAQSRTASDAVGAMSGEVVIGSSAAALNDFSCAPNCRWGDYAGATPDMTNSSVVWGTNELIGSAANDPQWTTQNFAVSVATAAKTTVSVNANSLVIQGPSTVSNGLTVAKPAAGKYTVADSKVPVTPGAGCTTVTANKVQCLSSAITQLSLATGITTLTAPLP